MEVNGMEEVKMIAKREGLYIREGETVQNYVKRLLRTLDSKGWLSDALINSMLNLEYSKATFKLKFPMLIDGARGRFVSGHSRYYANPDLRGRYHITTEWWLDHHEEHIQMLHAWVDRVVYDNLRQTKTEVKPCEPKPDKEIKTSELNGMEVKHNQFGGGFVDSIDVENGRMTVIFPKYGEKLFKYPDALLNGLLIGYNKVPNEELIKPFVKMPEEVFCIRCGSYLGKINLGDIRIKCPHCGRNLHIVDRNGQITVSEWTSFRYE